MKQPWPTHFNYSILKKEKELEAGCYEYKERGYMKLMLYVIIGELIKVLRIKNMKQDYQDLALAALLSFDTNATIRYLSKTGILPDSIIPISYKNYILNLYFNNSMLNLFEK